MVAKVNGAVSAGEFIGSNLDFYILVTTVDIRAKNAGGDAASQAKLDKIVEVIALNGQPVILAAPTFSTPNYTFKFAIEHKGSWATADALRDAIVAHMVAGSGFTSGNTTVTVADTL